MPGSRSYVGADREEQTIPITEDTIVLKISMEKPDSGETISEANSGIPGEDMNGK